MNFEVEVLLIEDNPYDVELTLRAFRKNQITNKITVINDGQEALDFLFSQGKYINRSVDSKIKLIIVDLKLPKFSGFDIIKKVKSDDRTKKLPIVVLTSSKEEKDIINGYKLGINSYIVKPVEYEQFFRCIGNLGSYWLIYNEPPV